MFIKDIIKKYAFVISMGFLIFYIDSLEFVDDMVTKMLILGLAVFKSFYFVFQSFKKIIEAAKEDVAYHNFLAFMAINISIIILSFGIDFLCLHHVDPSTFTGIPENLSFPRRTFELIYFSILNFSNFGFYFIETNNL